MSQSNHEVDPFDPLGVFKDFRTSGMDSWSKMMVQLVNTDAYAHATGAMLDAWLASSKPFRDLLENTFTQALQNLNMPTGEQFATLAERLTHIEMRLDDLEALLESNLGGEKQTTRSSGSQKSATSEGDREL